MIKRYELRLESTSGAWLSCDLAYRLYGMLMEKTNAEFAASIHNQSATPIAQYVSPRGKSALWRISLFGEEAVDMLTPFLEKAETLELNDGKLRVLEKKCETISGNKELLAIAHETSDAALWRASFISPCTFKTAGEYALFPTVPLLINSMTSRLDALNEGLLVSDPDMINMLTQGLRISSYNLHSQSFHLKGANVPGFCGSMRLYARLSPPAMEIWKLLSVFSGFSGVGVKCALGMGGLTIEPDSFS